MAKTDPRRIHAQVFHAGKAPLGSPRHYSRLRNALSRLSALAFDQLAPGDVIELTRNDLGTGAVFIGSLKVSVGGIRADWDYKAIARGEFL